MTQVDPRLYPFTSQFVRLGTLQYHYIEEGEGAPVVMLHGNPTWSFYYRKLIRKLSPHFRCLAPDHIGMGFSDKPGDADYRYTLAQRIDDLESFLEAKGIDRDISLIMHDWGGAIGMGYACRHPEAIRNLVILNTAAFRFPESKRFPLVLRLVRSRIGAFLVRAFNIFAAGASRTAVKRKKLPREVRRAYLAPYDSWENRIAILRFVQDIPLGPKDPGFDQVAEMEAGLPVFRDTPTLMIWGMKDTIFDHHFLAKWIGFLPRAEVHRLDDCGHYVLEDAQEEAGKLILDFLTR